MEQIIQWKQGFFKRNITIMINQETVGEIIPGTWRFKLIANIKEAAIIFTVKGLFKQQGIFINPMNQAQIGYITFNFWHTKATITLENGKIYQWQYTNFWNTCWELTSYGNTRILYHGRKSKGELTIKQGDHQLALMGLVIPYYLNHNKD